MKKLMLIDGNSLIYRAYFATAYSKSGILTNSQGLPVNAILTFIRMLNKLISKYLPSHLMVCFDAGKKTKRHEKMPSYKSGRSAMPMELVQQFPIIKIILDHMGIKRYEMIGIEADDIIGTLAKKNMNDIDVIIVSSDKDMYQLVDKKISIVVPQNGSKDDLIIDFENFQKKFGYLPSQVIDVKGLTGDPSDNLPGVSGVGPKGALKLIAKFSNIENIFKNIENIQEGLRNKLIKDRKMSLLCKEMATIDINIKIPFLLNELKWEEKISLELLNFLQKIELNSLFHFYDKKYKQNKTNFSKLIF